MDTLKYLVLKNIAHNDKVLHSTRKIPEVALNEYNKNIPSGTPKWEIHRIVDSEHIISLLDNQESSSSSTLASEDNHDTLSISTSSSSETRRRRCNKDWFGGYLNHGEEYYHESSITMWSFTYDGIRNRLIHNGEEYSSPTAICKEHHKVDKPNARNKREADGWIEVKYKNEQGELRPIDELRPIELQTKSTRKNTAGQQTQQ